MKKLFVLLVAVALAPSAFAETKAYVSSPLNGSAGDLIVQSGVLCPTTQLSPGLRQGRATITDDGLGTVTLDELIEKGDPDPFLIDLTFALGPGAFLFISGTAEASPAPGQTGLGSTAKGTGTITWGVLGGWTSTGIDFCLSSPVTTCSGISPHGMTVPALDPDSNTYDLGTWAFDAEGDYDAVAPYINTTSDGGSTNSQFLLRGRFVGASIPLLPLAGFGALATGLLVVGVRSVIRRK